MLKIERVEGKIQGETTQLIHPNQSEYDRLYELLWYNIDDIIRINDNYGEV